MARPSLSAAFGAGLTCAFLTLAGPGIVVAVADPGGSGGGHSSGHGNRGDGGSQRGHGHDGNGTKRDKSGTGDSQRASTPEPASRTPATIPFSPDRLSTAEAGGGDSSAAPRRGTPFVRPKATVGNVRPGRSDVPNDPVFADPDLSNAQPPAPLPPSPPSSSVTHGVTPLELALVDKIWAPLRPTTPNGVMFGIASLLIMPLAGAWLGYRQARAAKAATQLIDR